MASHLFTEAVLLGTLLVMASHMTGHVSCQLPAAVECSGTLLVKARYMTAVECSDLSLSIKLACNTYIICYSYNCATLNSRASQAFKTVILACKFWSFLL